MCSVWVLSSRRLFGASEPSRERVRRHLWLKVYVVARVLGLAVCIRVYVCVLVGQVYNRTWWVWGVCLGSLVCVIHTLCIWAYLCGPVGGCVELYAFPVRVHP